MVTQPAPETPKSFMNSMMEDILDLSQMSNHNQAVAGSEAFEKFFVKFGLVASEIENLQRAYPQLVGPQISEKLLELRRDSSMLTQELRKMDSRASDKINQLEAKCELLTSQITKLKEEVENLVSINSELHSKLSEAAPNRSFLDLTPKSVNDKVNTSQLLASEDKAIALRNEIKELRQQVDSERNEKRSYFAQVEWLRFNLEDSIKKYNEVLQEKLAMQDTLAEQLRDGKNESELSQQLQKYREREVWRGLLETIPGTD